jgi:hypothetical protein
MNPLWFRKLALLPSLGEKENILSWVYHLMMEKESFSERCFRNQKETMDGVQYTFAGIK